LIGKYGLWLYERSVAWNKRCLANLARGFPNSRNKMMQDHKFSHSSSTPLGLLYRATFFIWRRMPQAARDFFNQGKFANQLKLSGRNVLAQFSGRDDLYDREYYIYVDVEASRSAPIIVGSILGEFSPKSVIDVGCGTGALLAEFKKHGVATRGLEYSPAGLKFCKERGLDVRQFDIETGRPTDFEGAEAVVCFEVAEHVAEIYADPLVKLLISFSPLVFFTAAFPGQGGGADHINEQPNQYWIDKFEANGYRLIPETTDKWRSDWSDKGVAKFYYMNIMVFRKSD
jgi:SAM-dependent methyltransferase